jgi:hypothetical protein
MNKILYCLLTIVTAFTIISCGDRGGKELTSINPGLYEIEFNLKYGGQLILVKQRIRYTSEGTYESTNFQDNTAVEELKGKFKIENKQLIFYDNYYRLITQEGSWIKKDPSNVDVRKIKKGSYQYYFKFPNDQAREQYRGLGLSEGWKTYERISD